jgi:GNAT superfamily N-acetyltransferase
MVMDTAVANWLLGNDTGISSEAIVAYMEGATTSRRFGNHPHDPADLGRCIRLLAIAPDYRLRLSEMARVSPVWAALVAHWDELEALYNLPEVQRTGMARRCYDRMREIIDAASQLHEGS